MFCSTCLISWSSPTSPSTKGAAPSDRGPRYRSAITPRAEPETAKIPIIVVTSFALSGDDKKAMDAGASAYLAKPYSPRQLLDAIRKMLGDA